MRKVREHINVYLVGAIMYGLIEIIWRGHTHWSMVLTGGVCFLIIYKIAPLASPLLLRCLAITFSITAIEFAVGVIVNIIFELNVWDYTDRKFNLFGQICPLYSAFWFLLSFVGVLFCKYIYQVYREQ